MTEDEAKSWAAERFGRPVLERLDHFVSLVIDENSRQNLISPASVASIWSRHVVDSLQLLPLVDDARDWLDIGTGGGFPGMVIAIASATPMLLVEPRRKRADFLEHCACSLELPAVSVAASKIEQIEAKAAVISARAVAPIGNILRAASHCATPATQWVLPRGSVDKAELATIAQRYRLMFHVKQSLTNADSSIVVLSAG